MTFFNLIREQALALPGIGKALADKMMEMVENGRIRKVESFKHPIVIATHGRWRRCAVVRK